MPLSHQTERQVIPLKSWRRAESHDISRQEFSVLWGRGLHVIIRHDNHGKATKSRAG